MSTTVHRLKKTFRQIYPKYAKKLDNARSQKEVEQLRQDFLKEAHDNLAKALGKTTEELEAADKTAPITLTADQQESLITATGDTIEELLQVIMDGIATLQSMQGDDAAIVTVQLIISGVISLGLTAYEGAQNDLLAGAAEATAALAGVEAATVAVVIAIATLVIVGILIPIIYFFVKPANCVVFLINELEYDLTFKEDYNAHGKPMLNTSTIPAAVDIPGVRLVTTAGFIATERTEGTQVGTQYGFTYTYRGTNLSFGVECPLNGIYTDNNCYCSIGTSAEEAASETNDKNVQSYEAANGGISVSIKCNSGSGSIAYYIARVYKTPS